MTTIEADIVVWTKVKAWEVIRFAQEHFDLGDHFADTFRLRVSLNYKRSHAGIHPHGNTEWRAHANFGLAERTNARWYSEYSTIRHRSDIGEIESCPVTTAITALICHEIAHSVNWYSYAEHHNDDDTIEKRVDAALAKFPFTPTIDNRHKTIGGHGPRWQHIYALLRMEFVTKGVTTPEISQEDLDKILGKKKPKRKSPKRQITVRRENLGYGEWRSFYVYDGEVMAMGRQLYENGGFGIWAVENGKIMDQIEVLQNGRGARKWILDNLVNA